MYNDYCVASRNLDLKFYALQVFLVHPALLQSKVRVLLLTIDNLFSSNYKDLSFVETVGPSSLDASSKRHAWRNRAFRHQVLNQSGLSDLNKHSIPVKVCAYRVGWSLGETGHSGTKC